ncbi:M15 family metallopeptidase [Methylomagnum ishizawai]|uniref:M15 family metallopeptidase n=1 Tax=Methylomagnum ishizawai TaxID=1760988 RepID=UPI001C32AB0B|nr:M15 family metallopeptidase [Methylomagnum ishizawai]BBL75079.1 D-alanyl-D-alanine dipeptidase [Methylomagnum ishizawai]
MVHSTRFLRLMLSLLLAVAAGCRSTPPKEPGPFRDPDFAEVIQLDPRIHTDIRYATANNFTGHPLYPEPKAFLQRPAAEALVRVNRNLLALGYGLLIYDAYRPWSVTQALWDAASPHERTIGFVADPKTGSKHNRGCAVDVGLYELRTGKEVAMPSGYDEFSERAHPDYTGGPPETRRMRDLLRRAMETQGFSVDPNEWWHFNHKDWRAYRVLDTSFAELAR